MKQLTKTILTIFSLYLIDYRYFKWEHKFEKSILNISFLVQKQNSEIFSKDISRMKFELNYYF